MFMINKLFLFGEPACDQNVDLDDKMISQIFKAATFFTTELDLDNVFETLQLCWN